MSHKQSPCDGDVTYFDPERCNKADKPHGSMLKLASFNCQLVLMTLTVPDQKEQEAHSLSSSAMK